MSLAEWRASRLHETDLPSGLHVTLRDVDMTDLLLNGTLPPSVIQEAEKAAEIENSIDLQTVAIKLMRENGADYKKMLDSIVTAALIEPKIGSIADDMHITLDELTTDDKIAIMDFVNREVEQIKSFRGEQDQSVETI